MQYPVGRRLRVQYVVQRADQHRREPALAAVALPTLQHKVVGRGQGALAEPEARG